MRAILLAVLLAGSQHTTTTTPASAESVRAAVMPRASADDNRNGQREGIHVAASKRDSAANVFWTFGVAIKNGKLGALKALIREMSDAAQTSEPGTLIYEWTISGDEKSAEVHERYADSDAALRHLASFNANFADRLMALVQPTGMTIYGNPSAALRKELAGAKPVYQDVIGGFTR